jgi:simple sugar transport system permease protein
MKRSFSLLAFLGRIEGLPVAAVLAVLYGVLIITAPAVFTGYRIYMSFLETVSPVLVCALGLTLVITAGEIDLSFPAVVAFSGFVFAWVFKNVHIPGATWIGFILALVGGALAGYINGLLVAKLHVPSIMATLAAQFFWYGATVLLAGGLQLNIKEVRVEATRIKLFTIHGVISAFAGLLLTLNINVFYPTQGQGFLLPAMASVFVGGTSIAGGLGSIVGTFFGSYIIGSLEAGIVATTISGYWVQLVEGLVMAASVILNVTIGEGNFARLSDRIRHWGTPVRSNISNQVSPKDMAASK